MIFLLIKQYSHISTYTYVINLDGEDRYPCQKTGMVCNIVMEKIGNRVSKLEWCVI